MIKIGSSLDIHRLVPKRLLYIGGVKIKSKLGALAHSDGDAVLHAITESIIGALGKGDLGDHFPDSDNKYKNIRSSKLIDYVNKMLKKEKYKILNLDVSILLEKPKLGNNKMKIKASVAKMLKITDSQVNIKAGTMEGLGEIGAEQAIAAFATVLIQKVG